MLILPRMYGSTESHCERTSTSPGVGSGISDSTSAKSESFGKPSGRAASVICRFTRRPSHICSAAQAENQDP